MNRRRDGGSDRLLAALRKRFALNMSAKMVTLAREPVTPGLHAVCRREVSI